MENRKSGILLHIASLPGKSGIGTFGNEAFHWIDFLSASKQKLWQVLPFNPINIYNAPYSSCSAFAINHLFLNIESKLPIELLGEANNNVIEYDKIKVLHQNYLTKDSVQKLLENYDIEKYLFFCKSNAHWLDDYALYISLKEYFQHKPWYQWEESIKYRDKATVEKYSELLNDNITNVKQIQFILFEQWQLVKKYANANDIEIIGDLPIYIDYDSADVWSNSNFFLLNNDLKPTLVAGVPPDYFSNTGQLWGNPVYDWEKLKKSNYFWWKQRIHFMLQMFDYIRIDHFRALEAFWAVPYGDTDASKGKWIKADGENLLEEVLQNKDKNPFIAEDLGYITPEVVQIKDRFKIPGMKVLQFAFELRENKNFLPHFYEKNAVVYTATHDNATTRTWFEVLPSDKKVFFEQYNRLCEPYIASWELICLAWSSVAKWAIAPMQDLLDLDDSARMNIPGTAENNWKWKCKASDLTEILAEKMAALTALYDR